MSHPKAIFTELDASRLYARLVNELDPEPFIARLAPNVHYESQWVLDALTTRDAVAELLRGKTKSARAAGGAEVEAVICAATNDPIGMPLVALVDKQTKRPEATASFKLTDGLIVDVAICEPFFYKPAWLKDPDTYVWPKPEPEP
ncbi:MAG: hypothetical protein JSS28_10450 [Proteobacteria bacterium]|nr:hypothetical protein [Pseudomonadota bacterium]